MVACKTQKKAFLGAHYIETFTAMGGEYPNPNTYFIPLMCQHCEHPSCVPACPNGVYAKRDDGIVAVGDTSVCEGCADKPCIKACPYNAIDLDPKNGRIGKCDMCADLIDAGQEPACSHTCFSKAVYFGDLDDPNSSVSQAIAAWSQNGYVHQLKPETGNGPAIYYLLSTKQWQDMDDLYSPAWHNL
jgi:Fe-S-cluster-containing dehydrogenase component